MSPNNSAWTICARLESKGNPRTFKRKDGTDGRIANCIFIDNSSKVQVCFWDKEIDKFYPNLVEGKAYIISNASVRPANKAYNTTGFQYDITCTRETQLTEAGNFTSDEIRKYDINVDKISQLTQWAANSKVSVYAYVLEDPSEEVLTKKDGNTLTKTVLKISDQSNVAVDVIAWGDEGKKFMDIKAHQILLLSNVTVKEFQGTKNLSFYSDSRIQIDPQVTPSKREALANHIKSAVDGIVTDLSKQTDFTSKAGKSVIYSLKSVMEDAEDKILGGRMDKLYYNTFAYFDSATLNKNLTWQKTEKDQMIYLASAKISDSSSSMWVTVCSGGDTFFGMKPTEASAL